MKHELKEKFEVIRSEEKILIKYTSENGNIDLEVTKRNFQFDILNAMTDEELKKEICGQL